MAALRQRVRELEAQARDAEALAHAAELKAGLHESEKQQALGRAERELHARAAAVEGTERRLNAERRVLEQQRRALCKLPNSKHRAQVEELQVRCGEDYLHWTDWWHSRVGDPPSFPCSIFSQKQLEQERKEFRAREARRSVAEARLREQVAALKEELARLSKTEGRPAARQVKSSGTKNDPAAKRAAQTLSREHSCKAASRNGCGDCGAGPRTPPAHAARQARGPVVAVDSKSASPPPTALPPEECLVKRFACGRRMVHLDGRETLVFDNGDEQHSMPGGAGRGMNGCGMEASKRDACTPHFFFHSRP